MKIQGWFYPLRSGSFSAEIQQKRKTLLREKTTCETIPAEKTLSAKIQRKRNHSSEGKTNLSVSFFFKNKISKKKIKKEKIFFTE